jgi:hypothetical protein
MLEPWNESQFPFALARRCRGTWRQISQTQILFAPKQRMRL